MRKLALNLLILSNEHTHANLTLMSVFKNEPSKTSYANEALVNTRLQTLSHIDRALCSTI